MRKIKSRKASYRSPEIKIVHLGCEDIIHASSPGPGPEPPDYSNGMPTEPFWNNNGTELDDQILNGNVK